MARPQVRHALLRPLLDEPPVLIGIGESVGAAEMLAILVRLVRDPRLQQAVPVTIGT
ncbi:hypothetical protein SHJG_8589 [Streptomyces hygroscopicus subsp. jinggangensis 5008]|nr:hypothetical protein SHJG_8589 [Streptomyces hygroscopicus subsp. jinggangensis 5008]AGF68011.1 hypothetical protein SHJGH_8349 [Streptomyces hygroscopicus subsp. jinggangensis TL01]